MTVFGAVDCGTNSTRLLIGRVVEGRVETEHREMRITRLGEAVDELGELAEPAIERTVTVLHDYAETMREHGVGAARVTATSAARDAANRDRFFTLAEAALGIRPELLEGEEEAELSFLGSTAELDAGQGPFLVADIGGGSTEFAVGSDRVEGAVSVDMGSVRFTESYLHGDPPRPEELSACIQVARAHLDDVVRLVPETPSAEVFVGLAGTVSTVAAVELGLAEYDRDVIHHFSLEHEAAEEVFRTLATEPIADRVHNPGLEAGRADIIVGGCCILVAIFRHFGFERCIVSESDILDGLILSQERA